MNKPDCAKCREVNKEEFKDDAFAKCETCDRLIKYEAYLESKRKYKAGRVINRPG